MWTNILFVGVIMGSKSDWETMSHADQTLTQFGIPHECRVLSAHRTPDWMFEYASTAETRGLEVIIAAAGGAGHGGQDEQITYGFTTTLRLPPDRLTSSIPREMLRLRRIRFRASRIFRL